MSQGNILELCADLDKTIKITDADWIRLLNSVIHKLSKTFPHIHLSDLRSAAAMGIVLAHKKFDSKRSKNIMGHITSKGYFLAYDILRTEFKMRSDHGHLHDEPIDNNEQYFRTNPYQQIYDFEETMDDVSTEQLSNKEKQLLRERYLCGDLRDKIAERRKVNVATISVHLTQILNKIRGTLSRRKDITKKQREQLEFMLHNSQK